MFIADYGGSMAGESWLAYGHEIMTEICA